MKNILIKLWNIKFIRVTIKLYAVVITFCIAIKLIDMGLGVFSIPFFSGAWFFAGIMLEEFLRGL